jgi:hypothetical protein
MAGETNQFGFEDMGSAEPMSEIQKRKAQAQQTSQEAVQNIQQTSQREEQTLRQKDALGAMNQQMTNMKRAAGFQRSNFDEGLKLERDLSAISGDAKQELYDKQLEFQRDSSGRKMLNERQLTDWMLTKAAGEEDIKGFEQRSQQLHARKLQLMQAAYAKIGQTEKQLAQQGSNIRARELQMELAKAKAAAEDRIRKQKAKKGAMGMMVKGAFTVAGAVIGGYVTGGTGTAAGAALGSQLGSAGGDIVAGAAQ